MAPALPGVKVGPLDPDRTAEFGQVAATHSARTLIRLHSQAHPPALVRALARTLDPERTKALVMDEVRGYVAGLELENGDPVLPDGARVLGAQVRGERDTEQVLTFTYEVPSGRTAKWFAPYDGDELSESVDRGDEAVRIAELKDRGLVAWDTEGASAQLLRREAAGLRRERDALRGRLSKAGAEDITETQTDVRPNVKIVEDNEELRRTVEELTRRNAELEQLAQRAAEESLRPADAGAASEDETDPEAASEDPPIEGYDDLNARQLVDRIKDEETSREQVEAILAFELRHNDRKSVVGAAEQRLGNV